MRLGDDPGGVPKAKKASNVPVGTPATVRLKMPKALTEAPVVGAFTTRQPFAEFAALAPVNSTPIHQPPSPALDAVSRFRVTPVTAPVFTSCVTDAAPPPSDAEE
jgi:hypothetical protein